MTSAHSGTNQVIRRQRRRAAGKSRAELKRAAERRVYDHRLEMIKALNRYGIQESRRLSKLPTRKLIELCRNHLPEDERLVVAA